MKQILSLLLIGTLFTACSGKQTEADASGTFEAIETTISAEANGVLQQFTVQEGQALHVGQIVGYIDSTQLYLKKKQLQAQIDAVLSRIPQVSTQLAALRTQLEHAQHEYQRIERLYDEDGATGKQRDDARAGVQIMENQLDAQRSSLSITTASIKEETYPLMLQVAQVDDQLKKCRLTNPIAGTVLIRYVEPFEMAMIGKPLYKIADLSHLILRAYITGNQFASMQLNQAVKVSIDDGKGGLKPYAGTIEWMSDKAEFTPKTIQTKNERENLVYAIKVKVQNDGFLKIGMYGEINL